MIDKILNNTKVLEKALDATWLRNEAISQNIANVDTPGYKRKSVPFEEYLSKALDKNTIKLKTTEKGHIPYNSGNVDDISIKVTEDNSLLQMRIDGNNVDIDSEMASMAKNTIQYNTVLQNLNGSFKKLKSVISEGRR